jgi:hypothetical protein
MELQDGAIFFRAVVEKKEVHSNYVKLQFRTKRHRPWDERRHSREMNVVWLSDDESAKKQFWQAKRLRPGDELWVECYLEEWRDPKYCWFGRRWWNMLFG